MATNDPTHSARESPPEGLSALNSDSGATHPHKGPRDPIDEAITEHAARRQAEDDTFREQWRKQNPWHAWTKDSVWLHFRNTGLSQLRYYLRVEHINAVIDQIAKIPIRRVGVPVDPNRLWNAAVAGLIDAIDTYYPRGDMDFDDYASPWIANALYKELSILNADFSIRDTLLTSNKLLALATPVRSITAPIISDAVIDIVVTDIQSLLLSELTPDERRILVMYYAGPFTYTHMAATLSTSTAYVWDRCTHSRRRLVSRIARKLKFVRNAQPPSTFVSQDLRSNSPYSVVTMALSPFSDFLHYSPELVHNSIMSSGNDETLDSLEGRVVTSLSDTDIDVLTKEIKRAQNTTPADPKEFVRKIDRILRRFDLRLQIRGRENAGVGALTLRPSRSGKGEEYIQVALPSGSFGFNDADILVVRVTDPPILTSARVKPDPIQTPEPQ